MVRSPAWTRDELILACDLVWQNGWRELRAHDSAVIELSRLLRSLTIHPDGARADERFRNPNSVSRKTTDIATRHPNYAGKPTRGGRLDKEVLDEFIAAPDRMHAEAERLRSAAQSGDFGAFVPGDGTIIDDETGEEVGGETLSLESPTLTLLIPAIAGDDTDGPDLLEVQGPARGIAAVLAQKQLRPPLAVAVYGEWGSGKTFFMQKVKENIDSIALEAPDAFEPLVRHIHFGAWHYSRGDLWASLVERIFDQLDLPKGALERVLDRAKKKIDAIEERFSTAQHEIDLLTSRSSQINKDMEEIQERYQKELEYLKSVRLRDIWDQAASDQEFQKRLSAASEAFQAARTEIGLPNAPNGLRELLDTCHDTIRLGSRVKTLATSGGKWWKSPLGASALAGLIAIFLIGLLALITPDSIRLVMGAATPLAGFGSAASLWIKQQSAVVRKLLGPAERLQRLIDDRVEKVKAEHDSELQDLEEEASATRRELEAARLRCSQIAEELAVAQQEKSDLSPARVLRDFIAERAASDEYRKHFGVMGSVHRDLVTLNEIFDEAVKEADATVRRIILYIDDLDRCSPSTVLDVLEAVHLLLALPLFIVVVGIDRRVLDRAVNSRNGAVTTSDPKAPSSSEYLEKIFQLTYSLPSMTPTGCRAVLRAAVSGNVAPVPLDRLVDEAASDLIESTMADEIQTDGDEDSREEELLPSARQLAKALVLSADELATLDQVAPLVGATPRRAKRFGNIYSAVRARFAGEQYDAEALAAVIGMLVGAPCSVGIELQRPGLEASPTTTFGDWIHARSLEASAHVDTAEAARVEQFLHEENPLLKLPMDVVASAVQLAIPYAQR